MSTLQDEAGSHAVSGRSLAPPWPQNCAVAGFAMGCFWGAERLFWQTPGVWVTRVGYGGGTLENPTYEQVCSGTTGHAEVVQVVFDPKAVSFETLLALFWENHDPTQGARQGNDIGTQYRSLIMVDNPAQLAAAKASMAQFQNALNKAGRGQITTQIVENATFFPAEDYHQQYLAKNPGGYCGLQGTGVSCPS